MRSNQTGGVKEESRRSIKLPSAEPPVQSDCLSPSWCKAVLKESFFHNIVIRELLLQLTHSLPCYHVFKAWVLILLCRTLRDCVVLHTVLKHLQTIVHHTLVGMSFDVFFFICNVLRQPGLVHRQVLVLLFVFCFFICQFGDGRLVCICNVAIVHRNTRLPQMQRFELKSAISFVYYILGFITFTLGWHHTHLNWSNLIPGPFSSLIINDVSSCFTLHSSLNK